MTADLLEMDLFRTEQRLREGDLSKSLTHQSIQNSDRPWVTLRYQLPEEERQLMRELGGDLEDEFRLDFPIRFARDLVGRLPRARSDEQLEAAGSLIESEQANQLKAMSEELSKLGIDWSEAPAGHKEGPAADDWEVEVSTSKADNTVNAGEPLELLVKVKNKSDVPAYQVRALTKSDNSFFDEKELVFGRIPPGESREAKVPLGFCKTKGRRPGSTKPVPLDAPRECSVPLDAVTRQDVLKVRFELAVGEAPAEAEVRPTVHSLPQPAFAYTYQLVDNRPGNGDGQLARGEGVTLYLNVKNTGQGVSYETQALLQNLTGDGLLLHGGRFDISNMAPGDTRQVAFTFDVLDTLKDNLVKVDLSVVDRDLRVVSKEKITVPVTKSGLALKDADGQFQTREHVSVREQPLQGARVFGAVPKGMGVTRVAEFGAYSRIKLGEDRFGFVETTLLEPATPKSVKLAFEPLLRRSPPLLEVKPAALATRGDRIRVEGTATDGDQVLDTYIFAGAQKVFYQSNRDATDPKKLSFSHEIELNPGVNVITVVSRENEDTATSRTLVVRRDGPGGEALPTPKHILFGADWEFSE
jgi:carboxyl-terminal processing protease